MDREQQRVEPGNLVLVKEGNYLTEIRPGTNIPAQVLLRSPTVGLVLEKLPDRKVILVRDPTGDCIFVSDSSLCKI